MFGPYVKNGGNGRLCVRVVLFTQLFDAFLTLITMSSSKITFFKHFEALPAFLVKIAQEAKKINVKMAATGVLRDAI